MSHRVATWQPSELAGFLETVHWDRLEAVWRLAAMTGMRRGEILALRWRDIDLPRARLAVRRALVEVDYRSSSRHPREGLHGRSTSTGTRSNSSAHMERPTQERELWGDAYEMSDLVAAWENCSPIHPQALSRMFRTLVRGPAYG